MFNKKSKSNFSEILRPKLNVAYGELQYFNE